VELKFKESHSIDVPSIDAAKALDGKNFDKLLESEGQVFSFFKLKGGQYGVSVEIDSSRKILVTVA